MTGFFSFLFLLGTRLNLRAPHYPPPTRAAAGAAQKAKEAGYATVGSLLKATRKHLCDIKGFSDAKVRPTQESPALFQF